MKRRAIIGLCILFVSGFASAEVFDDDGGAALQGILNDATVGGDSSVNAASDYIIDPLDSFWEIGASAGSVVTLMSEWTGSATAVGGFGVYAETSSGIERVELLDISAVLGQQASVSISDTGEVYRSFFPVALGDFEDSDFGYYFEVDGNIWYSETGVGVDHMVAYQGTDTDEIKIGPWASGTWGTNEYVLAWEDNDGSDMLYDDFVVMVESVEPIPEPASMLLLGLGGLALRKRRGEK